MHYFEKKLRKSTLGRYDWNKTFKHPTNMLDHDDYEKLKEFRIYCFDKLKCNNCGHKYSDAKKQDESSNNLVLVCDNCLSNDILEDKISQDYVKWMDETQHNTGGLPFTEGFPILPEFEIDWTTGRKTVNLKKPNITIKKNKSVE